MEAHYGQICYKVELLETYNPLICGKALLDKLDNIFSPFIFLSFFRIPGGVEKTIERLQKKFLWPKSHGV